MKEPLVRDWPPFSKEISTFIGRGNSCYLDCVDLAAKPHLDLTGSKNLLKEIVDFLGVITEVDDLGRRHLESDIIFF